MGGPKHAGFPCAIQRGGVNDEGGEAAANGCVVIGKGAAAVLSVGMPRAATCGASRTGIPSCGAEFSHLAVLSGTSE